VNSAWENYAKSGAIGLIQTKKTDDGFLPPPQTALLPCLQIEQIATGLARYQATLIARMMLERT
jgi:hypothetical protein